MTEPPRRKPQVTPEPGATPEEPSIDKHKEWATAALEAYAQVVDGKSLDGYVEADYLPLYPALDDLLADLVHLVGEERLRDAVDRAVDYAAEEVVSQQQSA